MIVNDLTGDRAGEYDGNVSIELIDEQGPDHNKIFEVEARIGGKAWGRGKGSSKKSAEQQAAYEAILNLRKKK